MKSLISGIILDEKLTHLLVDGPYDSVLLLRSTPEGDRNEFTEVQDK
ncbi:hypothetical protein [Stenotrophomonas indicatrix]